MLSLQPTIHFIEFCSCKINKYVWDLTSFLSLEQGFKVALHTASLLFSFMAKSISKWMTLELLSNHRYLRKVDSSKYISL